MTIENLYSLTTEKFVLIPPSSFTEQDDADKPPLKSYENNEAHMSKSKTGISKVCSKHLEIVRDCFINMKLVEKQFRELRAEQANAGQFDFDEELENL